MTPSIPAERILVIQFRMIGDVLLCTPVVRALRHHYPKSYIAFCAEPVPAGALKGNPFIDEVIIHPRPATWRQEVAFWRRIRRSRFDLVVDLMGNPRSAILSCMSGAPHRIAFARWPRSLCYTMLVDHRHEVQGYTAAKRLRLLEPLGIRTTDVAMTMTYSPEEREAVDHFLRIHGVTSDELLICIDPTSQVVTRQWPGHYFSQLTDLLTEQLGARVCLLWGPGEKAHVEAIAAAARYKPLLNPAWELGHVAALLDRADLFVGCDSAPGHIAVSQHTPTVRLFGAQRSVNWTPPQPQHRAVVAGLPCQPCGKKHCGPPLDIACLRTLTVDEVFAEVLAMQPWVPKLLRGVEHTPLERE
jgi:predicted lipopolysaccharide heptosyltransferase III